MRCYLTCLTVTLTVGQALLPVYGQAISDDHCGVPIGTAATKLLRSVEREFGKPVECQVKPMASESGFGFVKSDGTLLGTPCIELDPLLGVNETEVVHELFHLRLNAHGFPANIAIPVIPVGVDRNSLSTTVQLLSDTLGHRLFYPKMVTMGFDPDQKYRSQVQAAMASPNTPDQSGLVGAVQYAYVAVLERDPAFVRSVETWYRKQGWTKSLTQGRRLRDSIIHSAPKSPDESAKELIVCLNILFDNKFPAKWAIKDRTLYLGTFGTSSNGRRNSNAILIASSQLHCGTGYWPLQQPRSEDAIGRETYGTQ
jgi:hypothetical protein